jgi:arsenate reductase-like glutaredoxin family protein
MKKNITFYWSENCSTCQKAKNSSSVTASKISSCATLKIIRYRRLKSSDLVEMLGGANELFSRRAVKYREMKLNERELSEAEMIDLMTKRIHFFETSDFSHRR